MSPGGPRTLRRSAARTRLHLRFLDDKSRKKAKADRLRKREEVKEALEQTTPGEAEPERVSRAKNLLWLGVLGVLVLISGALAYLVDTGAVRLPGSMFGPLLRSPRFSSLPRSLWKS